MASNYLQKFCSEKNIQLIKILDENKRKDTHLILGKDKDNTKIIVKLLGRNATEIVLQSIKNEIRPMLAVVDDAINCVQRIASNLRPPVLDELGFLEAVSLRIGLFQSNSKIQCETEISKNCNRINQELALALFKIIQEALTNILRHSKANKVKITLKTINNYILLTIIDNGIGIKKDQITNPESLGLLGIRERVEKFGGEFFIAGIPNEGTRFEIRIPLDEI